MSGSRRATAEDVDAICAALPHTWRGTSWGDVPTWKVPETATRQGKGKGFVLYRKPHKSAIDPETGQPYDDLLVIRVPSAAEKAELVEGEGPFFTIDHFNGYDAVLVQLARLGEIEHEELVEVITEAWRTCAPTPLVKAFDRGEE